MAKRRTKRDVYQEPTDPKFPQQWYLVCCILGSWVPAVPICPLRVPGLGVADFEACSHSSSFCLLSVLPSPSC